MEYKYDITLSFAGENREYVEKVAKLLTDNNVKVFYDKFEEDDLWGKDLGIHFDTIYRKSARYCIPFISKHYKEKIWTNYEIRNIISRAIENNEEYILPVRFDDTEIEGIRPTLGYLDLRKMSPEQLVNIILKKLKKEKSIPVSEEFQEKRNDVIKVALYHSYICDSFSTQRNGPMLTVRITNTIEGPYRYFYEPAFRLTKPLKSADGFYLTNVTKPQKFPVKLEYGQEIEISYSLPQSQLHDFWEQLEEGCEYFAICSTTIGEKFESEKQKVESIINAFKY
jgi:hypothetical protein